VICNIEAVYIMQVKGTFFLCVVPSLEEVIAYFCLLFFAESLQNNLTRANLPSPLTPLSSSWLFKIVLE